ncbi:ubiquinol-cytochrome C chaperone family protein [Hyphococcus flavus]|uniref:Ubiquinol-cytochrome C chaperone family protein n=1 Tax=Hyphococcus flavus TaxID=1866326 RepID=A0AAE9ZC23_9PROT|nr:ubiquinol-cytochrome C chaperone family protein [Hyphococcus flavus]WDI30650.1 ubiquinol-cytochrome C chaperone family protein [Hyphococcus flavus]
MFKFLFKKDPAHDAGQALYAAAVSEARNEALYLDAGAPDTVEGRFEMVALHAYLIMRRLKGDDGVQSSASKRVSQCLLDAMFANMDDSLREMGVGDLVVGKKIRKLGENFYGRIGAYEAALGSEAPKDNLTKALGRNIFGDEAADGAKRLTDYVLSVDEVLAAQPITRVEGGIIAFPGYRAEAQ